MTTIHTLASGSSGNSLLLRCGETNLLLDAGISCRRITAALRDLGLSITDLSAVLITHTHSDHISGMQTLLRRTDFPVYASAQTCRELSYRLAGIDHRLQSCAYGEGAPLGSCTVTLFPTSHDSPGSSGYRIDTEDGAVGVLTDTGYVTAEARQTLSGAELLVLEANHDVDTLRSGPYPYYLKQRILGSAGHLSNEDAAVFAVEMACQGTREIVLAHLSQENNTPVMAQNAVERALSAAGAEAALSVAPRDRSSRPYLLTGGVPCRR